RHDTAYQPRHSLIDLQIDQGDIDGNVGPKPIDQGKLSGNSCSGAGLDNVRQVLSLFRTEERDERQTDNAVMRTTDKRCKSFVAIKDRAVLGEGDGSFLPLLDKN